MCGIKYNTCYKCCKLYCDMCLKTKIEKYCDVLIYLMSENEDCSKDEIVKRYMKYKEQSFINICWDCI